MKQFKRKKAPHPVILVIQMLLLLGLFLTFLFFANKLHFDNMKKESK